MLVIMVVMNILMRLRDLLKIDVEKPTDLIKISGGSMFKSFLAVLLILRSIQL